MEVTIKGLGGDGFGFFLTDKGRKVSVPYTLPGEKVRVRLGRGRRPKAWVKEILVESKDRVEPKCKYFGKCGGCRLQHLSYDKQIEWKKSRLKKIFGEEVEIVPSPKIFNYRNRMDFVVTVDGTGLRKVGSYWDVVDIDRCEIHNMNDVLLRWNMAQKDFSRYDIKKQEGLVRYIVLRKGINLEDSMVSFQLNRGEEYGLVLDNLKKFFDGNLVYTLVDARTDVSVTSDVHVLRGNDYYVEELLGLKFKVPITSFFQTNLFQFEQLIRDIRDDISGSKLVDLFGGVGTIGILLSDRFDEVESLELVEDSVRLANENARLNGLKNFRSKMVDASKLDEISCDVLIVDPPRPGLQKSVKMILKSLPERIIYISCNPESQKEDMEKLGLKYDVLKKRAYDMFPHTQHMECVAWLERKSE